MKYIIFCFAFSVADLIAFSVFSNIKTKWAKILTDLSINLLLITLVIVLTITAYWVKTYD